MDWLRRRALRLYSNPAARAVSQAARRVRRAAEGRRLGSFDSINDFEGRAMSENGEDGIIKEIFFRIGHGKRFVEFGAADGSESNAALLAQRYGWSGLSIEGDPESYAKLRARFSGRPEVTVLNVLVTRENVVELFKRANVPAEFDLLSIDIDGNDYWVWGALRDYRPRLAVVEYNATIDPERFWVMRYDPEHVWKRDRYFGASLSAIAHQGRRLGYALIGTARGGRNAFLLRRDVLAAGGFPELPVRRAYHAATDFIRWLPEPDGPAVTSPGEADRFEDG